MTEWMERSLGSIVAFAPRSLPPDLLVAFSSRAVPPQEEPSPTAFLARRFADGLGLGGVPIVRATQSHGSRSVVIRNPPTKNEVLDAGECDALATALPGVALVVQTADCVPVVLAGKRAIGVVHAGWRGSVQNVAAAEVSVLVELGESPAHLRAWLGPSIGACCYEVGEEVATRFAGELQRAGSSGRSFLDLREANRAQLLAAGLPAGSISVHPACTKCGGEKYASYRRDGVRSGRMIALIARLSASAAL